MKNILYIFALVVLTFTSCDKDGSGDEASDVVSKHRVKRITGVKDGKEVQYLFNYNYKNMLDTVWICDLNNDIAKRDTLGSVIFRIQGKKSTANFLKRVLKIDADSVAILKSMYPNTYQDSLKNRRVYTAIHWQSTGIERPIKRDSVATYLPNLNQGIGADFKYTYLLDQMVNSRYEYNNEGKVVTVRQFINTYNKDKVLISIIVHKIEFIYSGNNVSSATIYKTRFETEDSNDSWEKIGSYQYTYSDKVLSSVASSDYKMLREGNKVTITENGKTTIYELNADDCPTKISYTDGSHINIEYEQGPSFCGDLTTPLYRKLIGVPYIR